MAQTHSQNTTSAADLTASAVREPDAAKYIGLSRAYLRAARIGRGSPGPAYIRAGRAILYRIADLDAWLDAHRVVEQRLAR